MKSIFRVLFLVIVLLGLHMVTMAQQADTTGATRMSQLLLISREKALSLKAAIQYNKTEIASTANDRMLTAAQRQSKLKQLIADRTAHINAVLTVEERQRFGQLIKAEVASNRQGLSGQ